LSFTTLFFFHSTLFCITQNGHEKTPKNGMKEIGLNPETINHPVRRYVEQDAEEQRH